MKIGYNYDYNRIVDTKIQRCLAINNSDVDNIANNIGTIFGAYTDYSDVISSLRYYPIHFPPEGEQLYLQTPKTEISLVKVVELSEYAGYYFMGSFGVSRYYNDFRDFTKDTYLQIYLPLCGFFELDPAIYIDDLENGNRRFIQVRLSIDFATGRGSYLIGYSTYDMKDEIIINSNGKRSGGVYGRKQSLDSDVIFTQVYEFNCGVDIPIGSTNAGDVQRNLLLGTVKTLGSAGLSLLTSTSPPVIQSKTYTKSYDIWGKAARKNAELRPIKIGNESSNTTRYSQKGIDVREVGINAFESSMNMLNTNIPSTSTDRPNNASTMLFLSRYVTLLVSRQRYASNPYDEISRHTYGLPLCSFRQLGNVKGFTKIGDIHFESSLDDSTNIDQATQYEVDLIVSKLKEGIVL